MITRTRLNRFYIDDTLEVGKTVSLNEDASHHLSRVLRVKIQDELILFNGRSHHEFHARITEITKRTVSVAINEIIPIKNESPLHTHLAQVIARGEKMDWILQKAVELGVNEITPLTSERCGVKVSHDATIKRVKHWRGIIQSAAEQCGRTQLPILNDVQHYSELIVQQQSGLVVICHPHEKNTWKALRNQIQSGIELAEESNPAHPAQHFPITICIGPEGGFTEDEINQVHSLKNAHYEAYVIQLGPRILRTETAGIVMLSLLQGEWGDF